MSCWQSDGNQGVAKKTETTRFEEKSIRDEYLGFRVHDIRILRSLLGSLYFGKLSHAFLGTACWLA